MEDLRDFLHKLQVTSGYKTIISDIKKSLQTTYAKRIEDYGNAKISLKLQCIPTLVSDTQLQSNDFLIGNTIFLKQADIFGELANNAKNETKPLLYHYAENSLFAFFVYSLLSYSNYSLKHGLKIIWGKSWKDTKVKIEDSGFFTRIIDCYTILGVNTHFSALRLESLSGSFEVQKSNPYPFSNQPTISLEELIAKREDVVKQDIGHYYDIIDFILLFYASSLARYRPYFWHTIVEGDEGTEIVYFEKCFKRFDLLLRRLARIMYSISIGAIGIEPPYPLNYPDFQFKEKEYQL